MKIEQEVTAICWECGNTMRGTQLISASVAEIAPSVLWQANISIALDPCGFCIEQAIKEAKKSLGEVKDD